MKGEIYNFILHSDIGTGTTVASKTFFNDWNRIPNSRYKLTFSFTSSTPTIATALMLCYILMNWDAVIILLVWVNLDHYH